MLLAASRPSMWWMSKMKKTKSYLNSCLRLSMALVLQCHQSWWARPYRNWRLSERKMSALMSSTQEQEPWRNIQASVLKMIVRQMRGLVRWCKPSKMTRTTSLTICSQTMIHSKRTCPSPRRMRPGNRKGTWWSWRDSTKSIASLYRLY